MDGGARCWSQHATCNMQEGSERERKKRRVEDKIWMKLRLLHKAVWGIEPGILGWWESNDLLEGGACVCGSQTETQDKQRLSLIQPNGNVADSRRAPHRLAHAVADVQRACQAAWSDVLSLFYGGTGSLQSSIRLDWHQQRC